MSGVARSRRPSECDICGAPIETGDDIAYIDGWKRPCCWSCWTTDGGESEC